jgi:membrane protease YdiL (CAAX protease family)
MNRIRSHPSLAALAEVALLFVPAIPAYLWLWPNAKGTAQLVAQSLTYVYLLAGALLIGLRRWAPGELGFNRKGWGPSLGCGAALLAGRTLVTLSVDWPRPGTPPSLLGLAGDVVFYVGFVGLAEETLFRGVVYHALETWKGARWAIWGSTTVFALYHIPGQGPLGGLGTFIIGLIFAAIRWRAGGIGGLVLVHGAIDIAARYMLPSFDVQEWGQPSIIQPMYLGAGYALIVAIPLYLWLIHPRLERLLAERST